MKKLPYQHIFAVVQINNKIEKIFFDEVINYKDYSEPDFDEHRTHMVQAAIANNYYADQLFLRLCQSYLNAKLVISKFKKIAKQSGVCAKNSCVALIVHIHTQDEFRGTIQIDTNAFESKRDSFNYIAKHVSYSMMTDFIASLTVEKQDLLFDF